MKQKQLTPEQRNAMIQQIRNEARMKAMQEAEAFRQTPEGVMCAALNEYLADFDYVPTRYVHDSVPVAWACFSGEWSGERASVSIVPSSESGACEVRVFRSAGRKLYGITTPSPAETLARLKDFCVDHVPVVAWAKEVRPRVGFAVGGRMTWRETLSAKGWEPMSDMHDPDSTTMTLFVDGRPKWKVGMQVSIVSGRVMAYALGNGALVATGYGNTEDDAFADLLAKPVSVDEVPAGVVLGLALPAGGG